MQQESPGKRSTGASEKPKGKSKKRSTKSKGLGDDIEKITKATGIKKVVDAIAEATGADCGCGKRKEWLNNRFPNYDGMSKEDQEIYAKELRPRLKPGITIDFAFQALFIDVYQRTFGVRLKKRRCSDCFLKEGERLEKAYIASCDS
jgi:hypothetical protein